MTAPKPRAKDGRLIGARAENGSAGSGLTEATQIVRGPAALLEAMQKIAGRDGRSISSVWRTAARAFVKSNGMVGKEIDRS